MTRVALGVLALLVFVFPAASGFSQAGTRPGVTPKDAWTCPVSHPIKGNFTPTNPQEVCIYHVAGGAFYDKTKPERCYAAEAEARVDGCRRSKR